MGEKDASAMARVQAEEREERTHGVSDLAKLGEGLTEGLIRGVPRQVSRERKDQLGDARRSWCRWICVAYPT